MRAEVWLPLSDNELQEMNDIRFIIEQLCPGNPITGDMACLYDRWYQLWKRRGASSGVWANLSGNVNRNS